MFTPYPKPEKQEKKKPQPLKRTPLKQKVVKLKPRTKKRAKQEREYLKKREKYLQNKPSCEICLQPATTIHHPAGRIGELLTDDTLFIGLCMTCHERVEQNPIWAKEQGYSLPRNSEVKKNM
jgi:hypothetical protein